VELERVVLTGLLDELDGLNPSRALILQAYYALRRTYPPTQIGTRQIAAWIKLHEPDESFPSDSLILLTLREAKVNHRPRGRPRCDQPTPVPAPPFLSPSRRPPRRDRAQP
jgi:hypothetical protein